MNKFKHFLITILSACLLSTTFAQTPLSQNGKLKLVGNQLSNECGYPVQLRGMSTHGPMWFQNCYTNDAVKSLAEDWGADIIRLAMYTEPNYNKNEGYLGNITKWDAWIDNMVTQAENNGMYIMIDWHILKDNDPNKYKAEAKTFFSKMSKKYKDKGHVLYEICNEPNGNVNWSTIKSYAEEIIPVIRANDPDAIIIVGTPEWSGKPWDVVSNKLTGTNAHNVMYTFHFYSGSHYTQNELKNTLGSIPVFVTEWGTSHSSGNGSYNENNANAWLKVLNGDNSGKQIVSWCNWSYADKNETTAALKEGACNAKQWTNTSTSGTYIRNIMKTVDNFQTCTSQSDSDDDGVVDVGDACPNTPSGETVNEKGCSDTDGDGIYDNTDLCPNTPSGATVDTDGCELNLGTEDFTAAIDSFNQVSEVTVGGTSHGIDWWVGEGSESTFDIERTTNGMNLELTNASSGYPVFGLQFGQDGSYINLKDLRNADVRLNLTNNSNQDIFLAIQLQDINGNKAEIFIEDPAGISWSNQWKKIGINIPKGQTIDKTLDLSSDPNQLGGFQSGEYNCEKDNGGLAVTCPAVSHEIDPTKITQMIFLVNGGAGTDNQLSKATGTLVFNYFSIGDVKSESSNIIYEVAAPDEDGDGIPDSKDLCPGTTQGEKVNKNGCALSTLDTDEDKVTDEFDQCPSTESGATVDVNGCSQAQQDDDEDGVANGKDECDNTKAGVTVDAKGCEVIDADTDNDGVLDTNDKCANTPSGTAVDSDGCETLSISDFEAYGLSIYPNPASSHFTIDQEKNNFNTIVITDLTGKIITTQEISTTTDISTENLKNGIYLLQLIGKEHSIVTQIAIQ